jgi:predicted NAD/FAD-binding protein
VRLRARGAWRDFDRVVLASHADRSLKLLTDASPEERDGLGAFRYSANRTILHVDRSALPRAPAAWASWNCDLADCHDEQAPVSVTYHLNRLQGLPGPTPFCVTLNGGPFREEDVLAEMLYEHPVMDAAAVAAQRRLQTLNGQRGTYFAGAHLRYGFHEDGLVSALRVAEHFGIGLER